MSGTSIRGAVRRRETTYRCGYAKPYMFGAETNKQLSIVSKTVSVTYLAVKQGPRAPKHDSRISRSFEQNECCAKIWT